MKQRAVKVAAAVGISALAVVGLDAATYAGTGDSLIVGKFNKSHKTTHLTTIGWGPALSLHAKGQRPALAVDSKAKIARLNADLVDGKDAAALQHNVRVLTATSGASTNGTMTLNLPALPKGRYQAGYEVYMVGATGTVNNPTDSLCYLYGQAASGVVAAYTTTTTEGFDAGLSGNGVITADGRPWQLFCWAYQNGIGNDDWSIPKYAPIRVTLTRIDKTTSGSLKVARTTRRAPLTGPSSP